MRFIVDLINRNGRKEKLYFVRILLYYIYPRAFICRSETDKLYMFYEMVSENDIDTWLVAEITEKERITLENGSILIQNVYSSDHDVFSVNYDHEREESSVSYDPDDTESLVRRLPKNPVYREIYQTP